MEIWKDIPQLEGHYQASSLGRIKSLKYGKERIVKQNKGAKGYMRLTIYKGKKSGFAVHVLVAMAFLGHKPDGTHKVCVDHIDNNRKNNCANNLKLINNRENASKDRKGGLSKYIGVTLEVNRKKWVASITFNYRRVHLGYYLSEIDAANAYQKALKQVNDGMDLNILYPKKIYNLKPKTNNETLQNLQNQI
jgi:hypothetical protein